MSARPNWGFLSDLEKMEERRMRKGGGVGESGEGGRGVVTVVEHCARLVRNEKESAVLLSLSGSVSGIRVEPVAIGRGVRAPLLARAARGENSELPRLFLWGECISTQAYQHAPSQINKTALGVIFTPVSYSLHMDRRLAARAARGWSAFNSCSFRLKTITPKDSSSYSLGAQPLPTSQFGSPVVRVWTSENSEPDFPGRNRKYLTVSQIRQLAPDFEACKRSAFLSVDGTEEEASELLSEMLNEVRNGLGLGDEVNDADLWWPRTGGQIGIGELSGIMYREERSGALGDGCRRQERAGTCRTCGKHAANTPHASKSGANCLIWETVKYLRFRPGKSGSEFSELSWTLTNGTLNIFTNLYALAVLK
ncbi:hypothetical protein K438DRAFT_1778703 [Mycena galopus ATCC 62051]|nr:hypothetical protein K438DRAFT_1778703 [Mycena galopus ATCC 62051]